MLKNNGFHNRHSPFSRPFSPASFFANGEQGWWYDPSNLSTLSQDSAGTTPVTAMEQPVGLQLDLSKGLVLGPELVTPEANRDFSSDTGYWTKAGSATIASGKCTLITGSSIQRLNLTPVGAWVVFEYDLTVRSGGLYITGYFAATNQTTSGRKRFIIYTTTGTVRFNVDTGDVDIDNISIKALPGNHRFQTTSANRPVVSARVNLLTKTEEFDNAAWAKTNVTVTANSTTSPNGTLTADTISLSAVGEIGQLVTNTGTSVTLSASVKPSTVNFVYLQVVNALAGSNAVRQFFNLSNGTVGTAQTFGTGFSKVSATIVAEANGFYRITLICTVPAANCAFVVSPSSTDAPATQASGNSIYIWGADLRVSNVGVNLPAYQRVNTSTDYDSTGFPTYIKPNGSNQFMVTNSINFSSTDKMTVWQGVRKLSDAAGAMLVELSTTAGSNNGSFYISAPEGGNNYGVRARGLSNVGGYNPATFTAPITNVVAAEFNLAGATVAACVVPRINGVVTQNNIANVLPGGGNFGTYPAYFYARAGTSVFFGGHDYGSIARGAASTAAQITAGETYINSKTKAY